ncbi:MAG: sugar phosphate isomerase/epimerase [Clostridia bacterium]|nr:sugar phosphate isomerase/epimerase [Clostridia bacterium]
MWNYKLCLGTSSQFGLPTEEQIPLFRQIGFDAFFTGWQPGAPIAKWREIADSVGIEYQSIHAPFSKMNAMWQEGEAGIAAAKELCDCLADCAANGVPIMVAHAFIGFKDHTPTQIGVENFRTVAEEAGRLGVKLALENTEGEEYLAALMEAFRSYEQVGFCWDTGHEMCYNHSKDMMALYGDRLIATHINDNLGIRDFGGEITFIDDLHLLPFDGIADWAGIASRLDRHGYEGIMTFELNTKSKPNRHENDVYGDMPIERYLTEVFKRACRVAALRRK